MREFPCIIMYIYIRKMSFKGTINNQVTVRMNAKFHSPKKSLGVDQIIWCSVKIEAKLCYHLMIHMGLLDTIRQSLNTTLRLKLFENSMFHVSKLVIQFPIQNMQTGYQQIITSQKSQVTCIKVCVCLNFQASRFIISLVNFFFKYQKKLLTLSIFTHYAFLSLHYSFRKKTFVNAFLSIKVLAKQNMLIYNQKMKSIKLCHLESK